MKSVVIKSLRAFLQNANPQKPLVMSFHGLTGSGKNYVASMIANSLYKKGMSSSYVHQYIANKDFPHEARVSEYQVQYNNLCFVKTSFFLLHYDFKNVNMDFIKR